MKTTTLKVLVGILIGTALGCGLGLPKLVLGSFSPLARTAVCAGGQLLAYDAMAVIALWMEPQMTTHFPADNEPPAYS